MEGNVKKIQEQDDFLERMGIPAPSTLPLATLALPTMMQDTTILDSDEKTNDNDVQVTSVSAPSLASNEPLIFDHAGLHWMESYQVKLLNGGHSSHNWHYKMLMLI